MTTSLPSPAARVETAEPRMPLNLFVAYADLESGRRAMELVQRLGEPTRDSIDLLPVLWRIDILNHDQSRPAATDDARRADIFVLGLARGDSFHRIAAWLSQVLASHRNGPTAIVAAVPDGFAQESEGQGCLTALADVASRSGATFLFTGPR